ncbi:hypothetical protein [Deinococcus petrolearius]|uniref:Uncharacterized protein n=1 Tax=Deinococcus petrolearius TaxID=1751295 RepID=A0ABW1DE58_9DEIO
MKVGLLESRAARLSGYWAAYLRELGVDLSAPGLDDEEALALGRESLPQEPATVQLTLGRVLALGRVDAALVPQLPAVFGDAWSEALTELLPRRISGLPALIALPDAPTSREDIERVAAEIGLRLSPGGNRVRLALDRAKPLSAGPRAEMPALTRASHATVGVIGPRALLDEPVLAAGLRAALEGLELHAVYGSDLPLPELLKRAERMENAARAQTGEKELFGAASLLAGKSAVRGLVFVAPARDGATHAALSRLAAKMHKPTLLLDLDAGQGGGPELRAFAERLQNGVVSREGTP